MVVVNPFPFCYNICKTVFVADIECCLYVIVINLFYYSVSYAVH